MSYNKSEKSLVPPISTIANNSDSNKKEASKTTNKRSTLGKGSKLSVQLRKASALLFLTSSSSELTNNSASTSITKAKPKSKSSSSIIEKSKSLSLSQPLSRTSTSSTSSPNASSKVNVGEGENSIRVGSSPSGSGRTSRAGSSSAPSRPKGAIEDKFPMYSCISKHYKLHEPIGFGASSVVRRATFWPLIEGWEEGLSEEKEGELNATLADDSPAFCAVKVIDIDRIGCGWEGVDRLRRETQLMSLSKHENLLRVRGEWVEGSKLYIATRLMNKGSILDIMRYNYRDGFQEPIIATVMKQCLEGINYLHANGWLHRDIKAANLLVDGDGTVLLADFGVSSSVLHYSPAIKQRGRKSFVGTPAYMAPEVVLGREYDYKADIYSFGITVLELTLGRAPTSLFPPDKILLKTINEKSPTLEREREGIDYTYSKIMKEMVDSCLLKDPSKRPTAATLLSHPFFKSARKESYLVGTILKDLPPLEMRMERKKRDITTITNHHTHTRMTSWDFHSISSAASGSEDPFEHFTSVGPGGRRSRDRSEEVNVRAGEDEKKKQRTMSRGVHVSEVFKQMEENMKSDSERILLDEIAVESESSSEEGEEEEDENSKKNKPASTTSESSQEKN